MFGIRFYLIKYFRIIKNNNKFINQLFGLVGIYFSVMGEDIMDQAGCFENKLPLPPQAHKPVVFSTTQSDLFLLITDLIFCPFTELEALPIHTLS